MPEFITTTFADGVLKPERELGLASGTRVRLCLESGDDARIEGKRACAELDRRCDDLPIVSDGMHLTREQLRERG
jgi:predicted DNA-binding antitoxin AbrB/MazE fold protein